MKIRLILLWGIFFLNFLALGQHPYSYSEPIAYSDGWKTHDFLSYGIDSTKFYRLFDQLNSQEHKIHSILLVREGKLEVEEYFNGYALDTRHDLRSVTKSIISLLMGIALDQGIVKSIDDPISRYLKNRVIETNRDPRKKNIAIKHLLTMSTGLDCNDWDKKSQGQEDRVYRKKDWLQYTLDLPQIHEPGEVAMYCTMGTVLAAEIISQASGMPIDEFAQRYLFDGLDIRNVRWGHTSGEEEIISSAKRLYMVPRDMAKIGTLVLNGGKWGSHQIVSEEWVNTSTKTQITLGTMDYGMLWWNIPFKVDAIDVTATVATGNGGQYIMIFRELKTVVVFTGGAYNSEEDKLPFAVVKDVFLPMLIPLKNETEKSD